MLGHCLDVALFKHPGHRFQLHWGGQRAHMVSGTRHGGSGSSGCPPPGAIAEGTLSELQRCCQRGTPCTLHPQKRKTLDSTLA